MTTPLVGRRRELEALRAAVTGVAGGTPGVVLLTGPPGVGKTRLARETLDLAASSGFAVHTGRAQGRGRDIAFAPLVAALGAELREGTAGHALVQGLPQLGLLFSGLDVPTPPPLGDPSLESARLVDGLARLVDRLARSRPLALLLDDVHDLDPSTEAFLHYLLGSACEAPVLLVCTARPDGPERETVAALGRTVAESTWAATRLVVAELADAEAVALVEQVIGATLAPALGALLAERCGGRPLFLDALARTLVETGRLTVRDGVAVTETDQLPVPDVVRDQLRIRLAGLDRAERAVLDVLATSDGGLEFPVLDRAAGLGTRETARALEALHSRALLGPGTPDRPYELVHGLLRETLLEELAPAGTAHRHADLARALLDLRPGDPRAAGHLALAGGIVDPALALDPLLAGVEHARRLGAGADVVRNLRAAVTAATALGRDARVADLRRDLARALRQTSDLSSAEQTWLAALAGYRELGDDAAVAGVEQDLAMLAWSTGDLDRARAHFEAAEKALAGLEPAQAHADLLFARVVTASRVGDTDLVARGVADLHALTPVLDSAAQAAQLLLAEAVLAYAETDYVRMVEINRRALTEAELAGDRLLQLRAHDQLSVAHASQLDLAALRDTSRRSLRIAEELGAPMLGGWPRARLAVADLLGGDWDAALRGTVDMCALVRRFGERRGAVSTHAGHAWVLAHRGRLDDAEAALRHARDLATPMLVADQNIFSIVALAGATIALARGDAAAAAERSAQLESLSGGWLPMLGIALLGEARALLGDRRGAAAVAERLEHVRSCSTGADRALAHWVRAVDAGRAGEDGPALEHLASAHELFTDLGLPYHAARARLAQAQRPGGGRDRRAAAVEQGREALEVFERLGAPAQAREARTLLRGLGVTPSRGRGPRQDDRPLSRRELEVARLVAAGRTNAQVATELFISPRTVTTHLDRMYSRLGLSSRVALTRYLADSGLLDETD